MAPTVTDGRQIDHQTLEWMRMRAVEAIVIEKRSPEKVTGWFKVHRTVIYRWLRTFRNGGWEALKSTKAKGPDPKLTQKEKQRLSRLLMKNPLQLHFDFGLWTLEMVQELIRQKCTKEVSIPTVTRILSEIGYSRQKPLQRAYEQDPDRVRQWKEKEYPAIVKEAKQESREIFFEDESGFRSTGSGGTTWAQKGKTPIVRKTGKRYGINSISAISRRGKLRFMLFEGTCTADVFVTFLKRLLKNAEQPIALIVDGHPTHKTKAVREFIVSTNGMLKLYFLPPYSPELNPDEQVWNHAKHSLKRKSLGGKQQFVEEIHRHLRSLQRQADKVSRFFLHPDVAYAV
jgi:transposase